jgi:hypothetical protein
MADTLERFWKQTKFLREFRVAEMKKGAPGGAPFPVR